MDGVSRNLAVSTHASDEGTLLLFTGLTPEARKVLAFKHMAKDLGEPFNATLVANVKLYDIMSDPEFIESQGITRKIKSHLPPGRDLNAELQQMKGPIKNSFKDEDKFNNKLEDLMERIEDYMTEELRMTNREVNFYSKQVEASIKGNNLIVIYPTFLEKTVDRWASPLWKQ